MQWYYKNGTTDNKWIMLSTSHILNVRSFAMETWQYRSKSKSLKIGTYEPQIHIPMVDVVEKNTIKPLNNWYIDF